MSQDIAAPGDRSKPAYGHYLWPVLALWLMLWPLLPVRFPPFLDYYSHLARVHITSNIGAFSEFYASNEIIPPNVALDVVVGTLHKMVPIETAGWLFIVSLLVIQATGVWLLNKKLHGRQALPIGPLFGCAILYNSVLTMGFLNYLFGLGLMLWMVWLWLLVRERSWWIGLSVGTGAALLLYFAHIIVLGIYGIIVAGYELQQLIRDRRKALGERSSLFIKSGIPFLLPAVLYLTSFHGDMNLVQYPQNFFLEKLHALAGTLDTGSSSLKFSAAGFAVLGVLTLALGRVKISADMVLPIVLLTLLFLGAPTTFGGGRYFAERLTLPVALLICASLRVDFAGRGRTILVAGGLAAFLGIRAIDLSRDFMRFDAEVRESLGLFRKIEPGSVVGIAIDTTHPEHSWSARGRANWHVASLAAFNAPVFVATTHAQRSQHTIVLRGTPFTDLYAWQREIPVEVADKKQLNDAVTHFREISRRAPDSGPVFHRKMYVLLLMPHTLAPSAGAQGIVIGKTRWFLLLQLSQQDPHTSRRTWRAPGIV